MTRRLLVLLIAVSLLPGCSVGLGAALAVGAAAGYYYGRDHRTFKQINVDQNISGEINTALYRQAGVKPSKIQISGYVF